MNEEHPYLSIVIPLFNEEASLQPLFEELEMVLEALQRPYEVVFVDDGSTDGSFATLQRCTTWIRLISASSASAATLARQQHWRWVSNALVAK